MKKSQKKIVGLAQQNGFDPTFFFKGDSERLAKGTAHPNINSAQLLIG
jgi:hypothetical protein